MLACWHSRSGLQGASLLRRHVTAFAGDVAAGVAIKFALSLPVLLTFAGVAIDYSSAASTRSKMQSVANSAALASVRELQLARSDAGRVTAIANNVVNSQLPDAATRVAVDFQAMTVQVFIEKTYEPIIRTSAATSTIKLQASAKAKMSGSMPLCLLGLDPKAPQTIGLEQSAFMTAPGCLVQSNSTSTNGIQSKDGAILKAGMICSAGGKVQSNGGNYSPTPVTDCPALGGPPERPHAATGRCLQPQQQDCRRRL